MGIKDWFIGKVVVKYIKESSMWKILEGKKTYITMALIVIFGGLDAWNTHCITEGCKVINIPPFVFSVLGALGIWTRAVAKPK